MASLRAMTLSAMRVEYGRSHVDATLLIRSSIQADKLSSMVVVLVQLLFGMELRGKQMIPSRSLPCGSGNDIGDF